jgi:diguanylate cyclase (GGDEF)-like protein/PAS domain S-box-containing protein
VFDWNIVTGESWRSDSFDAIFNYRNAEMPRTIQGWRERVHPEDRERVDAKLESFFASDGLEWNDSYRFRRGDGGWAIVLDRGRLERDAAGKPLRMVGGMVDITRQQQTEAALHEHEGQLAFQASHDDLTGLLNRGALLASLQHRLTSTVDCPVSLLYLEIDDFNLINDSLGHEVGDEVLRIVGSRLHEEVGGGDRVGRLGGSEFVAVLSHAEFEEPVEQCRQPRAVRAGRADRGARHAALPRPERRHRPLPEHGHTPEKLFKRAGLATHEPAAAASTSWSSTRPTSSAPSASASSWCRDCTRRSSARSSSCSSNRCSRSEAAGRAAWRR